MDREMALRQAREWANAEPHWLTTAEAVAAEVYLELEQTRAELERLRDRLGGSMTPATQGPVGGQLDQARAEVERLRAELERLRAQLAGGRLGLGCAGIGHVNEPDPSFRLRREASGAVHAVLDEWRDVRVPEVINMLQKLFPLPHERAWVDASPPR